LCLADPEVAGELVGREARLLRAVEEEVDLADGVDDAGRPDPGVAASQR
jgi:hypothetical protein